MSRKIGKWDDLQIGSPPQEGQVERAYGSMVALWVAGRSEEFNTIRKNLGKQNKPKQR